MALALVASAAVGSGCGGGGDVAEHAPVHVYVSVPLSGTEAAVGERACAELRGALSRAESDGEGLPVEVRVTCLDDSGGAPRWTLAAVGANARAATEDSTTVAYVGELDPAASRFSETILEAAGIAQLPAADARAAAAKLIDAIRAAGVDSELRDEVLRSLEG